MNEPAPLAPRRRSGAIDLLLGTAAGSALVLAAEFVANHEDPWYLLGPPLLGMVLGGLLGDSGPLVAMAGFYVAGMVWAGVLGHLNLLPCATASFVVPTLLFGGAAMAVRALDKKLARRP